MKETWMGFWDTFAVFRAFFFTLFRLLFFRETRLVSWFCLTTQFRSEGLKL